MKFASSLVFAAAAASAALAAPKPQAADGGHGVPPAATISSSTSAPSQSAPAPAAEPKPAADGTGAVKDIQIPFTPSNAVFKMEPADADTWAWVEAPSVFNVTAPFALKNQDKAKATFTPPQPFAGIEVWMYQRSDGGVMTMSIDGVAVARLDYFNRTAGESDAPVKIYENPHLKRSHHVVEFENLEDPRVKKFGQFNLDRVLITAAPDPETAKPEEPTTSQAPPAASATIAPAAPTTPPLTAPSSPAGGGADASSQQTGTPGNTALPLSSPKALLSVAALVAAGLALF